jgi:hypothetical protein
VTPFADRKIVTSKGTLAIVTSHATLRARSGVMIQRRRLSDLAALRHSRSDLMALVTTFFLVLRMTEPNAKRLRVLGSALVAT